MTEEISEVTRVGVFSMQICVPERWTDEQAVTFAETTNPSGTNGWFVRKDKESLADDSERNPCILKPGFVHITLFQ